MAAGVTIQLKRHKTGELDMTTVLKDGELLIDYTHSLVYIGDGESTLDDLLKDGETFYLNKQMFTDYPPKDNDALVWGPPKILCGTGTEDDIPTGGLRDKKPALLNSSFGSQNRPVYISNGRFAVCNRYPVVSIQDNNTVPRLICGIADGDTELGTISTSTNWYTLRDSPGIPETKMPVGPCYIKNGVVWTAPSLNSQETIPARHYPAPYNIAPALTAYTKGLTYDRSMTLDEILTNINVRLSNLGG